jgi:hypothetical protein
VDGSDGPLPVAPDSAPASRLDTELNARVVAVCGAVAGSTTVGVVGRLETELKAGAATGAVTSEVSSGGTGAADAGVAGRLETDEKPWAVACAGAPSNSARITVEVWARKFIGRRL